MFARSGEELKKTHVIMITLGCRLHQGRGVTLTGPDSQAFSAAKRSDKKRLIPGAN